MAITISMPTDKEGQYALATAYWGYLPSYTKSMIDQGNTAQLQRAIDDAEYQLNRAADRLERYDPETVGRDQYAEEYADWANSLSVNLERFQDVSDYISGLEGIRQYGAVVIPESYAVESSDTDKMLAGEMQPVRNDFIEQYGDEGGDKYIEAMTAWREAQGKPEYTDPIYSGGEEGAQGVEGQEGAGDTGATTTTTTTTNGEDPVVAARTEAKADLLAAYEAGVLSYDQYLMYTAAVEEWDSGQEVNFDTVISQFNELTDSTIDPYYQDLFARSTESFQSARDYQEAQRALALDAEDTQAQQNLKAAKANLEASGMTFSGEARSQLGSESAFRQDEATTTESPVEGLNLKGYIEGTVPQASRLISESSELVYQEQMEELARQAEGMLGTERTSALGMQTAGDTTGSIQQSQESTEAGTLSSLYQQQLNNVNQGQLVDFLE